MIFRGFVIIVGDDDPSFGWHC